VPGFPKHTRTSLSTKVWIIASAPFTDHSIMLGFSLRGNCEGNFEVMGASARR
jgi:hypothetical protein